MDAKMVNKGFIIAFPITFIIFIGYMVIQVIVMKTICLVSPFFIWKLTFEAEKFHLSLNQS